MLTQLLSLEEVARATGCRVPILRAWADAGIIDGFVVTSKRWRALGPKAPEQVRALMAGVRGEDRARLLQPGRRRAVLTPAPAAVTQDP